MNKTSRGFTVIEIMIVIFIFGLASIIFFTQKANIESASRDSQRKTAINTIYYSLEEVYFKENGFYPRNIQDTTLRSVPESTLSDPQGVKIGEADSDYRYEATDCDGDQCAAYTLRTTLETEDDYVKQQRD